MIIVGVGVGRIGVLVQDMGIGNFLLQFLGYLDVALRVVPGCFRGCAYNLCSQGLQGDLFFPAHFFRHGNDAAVAPYRRGQGHALSCIARCGFNESISGFDAPGCFRVCHHFPADAVLYGPAGVKIFTLGKECAVQFTADLMDPYNRGAADGV